MLLIILVTGGASQKKQVVGGLSNPLLGVCLFSVVFIKLRFISFPIVITSNVS